MRAVSTVLLAALALGMPALVPTAAVASDAVRSTCATAQGSLNIREFGQSNARKIGSVPGGACVTVIGVCEASDGYCNVEYRGVNGVAARRFLR